MYLSVVNTDFFWIGRNGKEQTPTKTDTWQTIRSTNETVIWYLNVSHVTSKINSNSHHKKATRITISNNNNNNNGETAKYQKKRSITSTWYYTSNEQNVKDDWLFYCYRQNSNIVNREKCHRVPFKMLICPFFSKSRLTQSYRTELPSIWMLPLPSPQSSLTTHTPPHPSTPRFYRYQCASYSRVYARSGAVVCGGGSFKTAINIYAQSAYFIWQQHSKADPWHARHAISPSSHSIGNMVWIASSLFDLLTLNLKSFH